MPLLSAFELRKVTYFFGGHLGTSNDLISGGYPYLSNLLATFLPEIS